jgi:flagellar hook protein FlgE
MGSFSTPLSGLTAAQEMLQTVSNNLSNMNTDGYKDRNLTFSDIFSQANQVNGSGDPIQTGFGVSVSSTDSIFTEGNLNATNIDSNMALNGNGFFVTQGAGGLPAYTRAGDFTTNNAGQLTTPSGELLLGYPAVQGVPNPAGSLQPLQVGPGLTSSAVPSTMVGITANLDSDTANGGTAPSSSLSIYDSLGAAHVLTVSYSKTVSNTWNYTVSLPSQDVTGVPGSNVTVGSGTLVFNSLGQMTPASTAVPISIPILFDQATVPLTLAGPFGTAASPTITQTAMASATSATTTDGFASGTLKSYAVQPDGTIQGTFSSGKTLSLGQVAVATFANNQGLASTGNNDYQATLASGPAVVGVAGTGGRGTIVGGSVEGSNVDIASEFAKLIVAQQAYGANAKSITTFNQISQATLAMIQ